MCVLMSVCCAGAALGPLLAGLISPSGWNNVFYMLISADVLACLVSKTLYLFTVVHEAKLSYNQYKLWLFSLWLLNVLICWRCSPDWLLVCCLSSVPVQTCLQGSSRLVWTRPPRQRVSLHSLKGKDTLYSSRHPWRIKGAICKPLINPGQESTLLQKLQIIMKCILIPHHCISLMRSNNCIFLSFYKCILDIWRESS